MAKAPDIDPALYDVLPSGYMIMRLGWTDSYQWQLTAADAVAKENTRVAVRTCNESGKTTRFLAGLFLWHMETFQRSLTVATSGSWTQLDGQMLPALRAAADKRHRELGRVIFEFQKGRARCLDTGSEAWWFSTDDPGRAEGWHSGTMDAEARNWTEDNILRDSGVTDAEWERIRAVDRKTSLMLIFDEAKSIPRGIWHAAERCHATRFVVASSTGATNTEFYDCFYKNAKAYATFKVPASECPHLWEDPVRRAELEAQRLRLPAHLVASLIDAEFADSGDNLVFDGAAVNRAMSGIGAHLGAGIRRAAMDLSAGGDGSPLYASDGNRAWLVHEWRERNTMRLARLIKAELEKLNMRPEWVYADNGGLGKPILDHLAELGWEVNRVDFGGVACNSRFYRNQRAEMYVECARRIRDNELLLAHDTELRDQFMMQKYLVGDGPIQLVPKKSLPRSPDRADAVVMLFKDLPAAKELYGTVAEKDPTPHTGKWKRGEVEDEVSASGLWN